MLTEKDFSKLRNVVKGKLGDLVFQVNPTEINYSGGGWQWSSINSPNMKSSLYQRGSGKPMTITFDLYMNAKMARPVNPDDFFTKMEQYRDSEEPVIFAYGKKVYKVVVQDCNIVGKSYNTALDVIEAIFSVTLGVIQ